MGLCGLPSLPGLIWFGVGPQQLVSTSHCLRGNPEERREHSLSHTLHHRLGGSPCGHWITEIKPGMYLKNAAFLCLRYVFGLLIHFIFWTIWLTFVVLRGGHSMPLFQ